MFDQYENLRKLQESGKQLQRFFNGRWNDVYVTSFTEPVGDYREKPNTSLDPKGADGSLKPQLQLIPPVFNVELAKAISNGKERYGAWNWRVNEVEMMTYIGAMKRHIDAILDGEDIDPKSKVHHLGHIAANCAIVLDAKAFGTLVDNRPPKKVEKA